MHTGRSTPPSGAAESGWRHEVEGCAVVSQGWRSLIGNAAAVAGARLVDMVILVLVTLDDAYLEEY